VIWALGHIAVVEGCTLVAECTAAAAERLANRQRSWVAVAFVPVDAGTSVVAVADTVSCTPRPSNPAPHHQKRLARYPCSAVRDYPAAQ
jgi:hypothetical protein